MKLLTGIIALVAVTYVGINVAGHNLLSKALENTLGVPVTVDKVKFDVFGSQAGIYGLKIQNPKGFKEETLASVPEVSLKYDLSNLLKKEVTISEIRLNLDEVTVERSHEGKVNLLELDAVKGSPAKKTEKKDSPQAEKGEAKEPPVNVKIEELNLSIGRAKYVDNSKAESTVKEFPVEIKNSVIRDVTEPDQVVSQVVLRTMKKVGLSAMMPDMDKLTAGFKADAQESLGGIANKLKASLAGQTS